MQQNSGKVQLNINTTFLAICMGLSGWILLSVNSLDERFAAQQVLVNSDHEAIIGQNKVINDQSKTIELLSDRLIKLETLSSKNSH